MLHDQYILCIARHGRQNVVETTGIPSHHRAQLFGVYDSADCIVDKALSIILTMKPYTPNMLGEVDFDWVSSRRLSFPWAGMASARSRMMTADLLFMTSWYITT